MKAPVTTWPVASTEQAARDMVGLARANPQQPEETHD
jgi:hypothetical protein